MSRAPSPPPEVSPTEAEKSGTRRTVPASVDDDVPPDAELARRTAAGEAAAFETLVARHHGRVYRFLASFLRSPEDAADVTQETFLNAYRNAGSFRGEAAFRTWLLRIARHAGVSRLRATKRRGELGRSAPGGDVGDAADRANTALPDPAVAADVADRRRVVRDAIDALPEDQRAVVLLREVEGLDYDAIAAALEVPVGTVRSRLHRAREALRLKLEPYVRS